MKKIFLSILVILIFLLYLSCNNVKRRYRWIIEETVEMRKNPDFKFPIHNNIKWGEKVLVLDELCKKNSTSQNNPRWCKINYKGDIGFILINSLSANDPSKIQETQYNTRWIKKITGIYMVKNFNNYTKNKFIPYSSKVILIKEDEINKKKWSKVKYKTHIGWIYNEHLSEKDPPKRKYKEKQFYGKWKLYLGKDKTNQKKYKYYTFLEDGSYVMNFSWIDWGFGGVWEYNPYKRILILDGYRSGTKMINYIYSINKKKFIVEIGPSVHYNEYEVWRKVNEEPIEETE